MTPILIAAAILVSLYFWQFNRLVRMKQLVNNAWSDVDVFLKRRAELVPNLVAAVKGAASYEQSTFERIAAARSEALTSRALTPQRAQAESEIASGVTQVLALAEAYPELKASENFLDLQRQLSENERQIASARQYYNACVRDFNTMIESFPSSIIASSGGFKHREFFEVESLSERQAPSARLS